MSVLDKIIEFTEPDSVLIADGFDDAVIGLEPSSNRVVYSIELCYEILVQDGMSLEEAIEYMDFNVIGAYVGEKTPIFIYTMHDGH